MIKNEDIICISSIDWDFIWQGHQEIMTRLARNGNRVIFIENTGVRAARLRDIGRIRNRFKNWKNGIHGIRKIEEGLYVYSPLVLPFPYLKIARFINKRLMFSVLLKWLKAVGFNEPIVWAFLPTGLSLDLIDAIEPKALVYYCIDSFESSSSDAKKVKATERSMLLRADLVFVTSVQLSNHCSQFNQNVHYFPFGVNIDNFSKVLDEKRPAPSDIKDIKRPIVGYIGGIHKWIDLDLVRHMATGNPSVSFVFVGPIQTDISVLKDAANVSFLGQKKTEELPAYVKEFDLALIPYRITDYTRNVYPTKLNEYLSMGKRVVSTELPEIIKFNKENKDIVKVAGSKEGFSRYIKELTVAPLSEVERRLAIEAAKKNSWAVKIEEMSLLIEKTIAKRAKERERSWKDNIARIYKGTRKRLMPAVIIIAMCYIVLFHTPLVWVLADPLKVTTVPAKSDAILVLGAGVGESGKVGQGYEERANSAVNLYKTGLANEIIYSSGYKNIMKEAEVMKALSIFMGIASDNILLDDTPTNTYEMIKHFKELAEKRGWHSAIIVSSPYHMRRVKMLCDKNMKGMTVYYFPIEQSSFYARTYPVKLSQIRGILQEYIAILYYKFKGYA